jgi:CheY-like chemotaxis protein
MIDAADHRWRVLLVEDEEEVARTTKNLLERRPIDSEGGRVHVEVISDFDNALTKIEERRYDAIVLDIRDQDEAKEEISRGSNEDLGDDALPADKGLAVYDDIRDRRFIPVVFYSAVANLAEELSNPPFVTVVSKISSGGAGLREEITKVFDSKLPSLNRSFANHVDDEYRKFMIGFVEKHWDELSGSEHRGDLAYLMVRRLARSLDSTVIPDMAGVEVALNEAMVHPTRLYIMPPLDELRTGDLIQDTENNWFVVLTPSCDLVIRRENPKASHVLMASCDLLADTKEYKDWRDGASATVSGKLKNLIGNKTDPRDRYYFLPAAWDSPDLVIDLQRLQSIKFDKLKNFTRVATLDDPYAQSVIAQFGRYSGRVGTPDVNTSSVKERLEQIKEDSTRAGEAPPR